MTTVADRTDLAESMLRTILRRQPSEHDYVINHWWTSLPEPSEIIDVVGIKRAGAQIGQPVRDNLIERLTLNELSRVVFPATESETVAKFTSESPGVVRKIASTFDWPTFGDADNQIRLILKGLNEGQPVTEMVESVPKWLPTVGEHPRSIHGLLLDEAVARATKDQRIELVQRAFQGKSVPDAAKSPEAWSVAQSVAKSDSDVANKYFVEPINQWITEPSSDFMAPLHRANEIGNLLRRVNLDSSIFHLPDLRMPKFETSMTEVEIAGVRTHLESSLRNPAALRSMLGDGTLGRLVPQIFGNFEKTGGIVGRPQHAEHDFSLGEHTVRTVQRVAAQRGFAKLTPKDQTNVLLAALHHDVGKRAGAVDDGHEAASANICWGVMRTLGYHPTQIQRVANLIARDRELSYHPDKPAATRFGSYSSNLDDIATFYRHPAALDQLRILNEADIGSVHKDSRWLTSAVKADLDTSRKIVGTRVESLNRNAVPYLTTELPSRWQLKLMDAPYNVLAHASEALKDNFFAFLPILESPGYSMSASQVTESSKSFYGGEQQIVALVSGPAENISQAYRTNLGTGCSVGWQGHIELTRRWSMDGEGAGFARELDGRARRSGITSEGGPQGYLKSLRRLLSQYNSADELIADKGIDSAEYRAHREFVKALTPRIGLDSGTFSSGHSEIKMNSPTVAGVGLVRHTRENRHGLVYFEGMTEPTVIDRFLAGQQRPAWLATGNVKPESCLTVPNRLWKEAQRRNLPMVVLDP